MQNPATGQSKSFLAPGRRKAFVVKLAVASASAIILGVGLTCLWFFNEVRNFPPVCKRVISDSKDNGAVKILFIGNSLTFVNMMPAVLAEFIEEGLHKQTKIYQVCVPGETLNGHWTTGVAQKVIADSGPWDYVVLQGASGEPYGDHKNLEEYAKRFDTLIKAAHAKTILFETWADKGQNDAQTIINAAYTQIGQETGAQVIQVGESFFYAEWQDKKLNLYQVDRHHPSQAGTYLAACVFYSSLFGKVPHALPGKIVFRDIDTQKEYPIVELDANQSAELQDFSWQFKGH